MPEAAMRIGELARKVGTSTSALRYYEKAGLVGPPDRAPSGYRMYGPEAVGRLQFLLRAKTLGLSLDEVRQLLASPLADADEERARLRHLVAHKLANTKGRIAELLALERELQSLYVRLHRTRAPECGHIGDCACWLPTEEEVMKMADEVAGTEACTCDCADSDCDCGCSCCGQG
jgi:DNA-binding transcriptional MerR regulator